jgi:hypothetical protein
VAVVHHDFANSTQSIFLHQVVGGTVAGIPRGLVIHEHVDFGFAGDVLNRERVFEADGQRFFHHDVNAVAGADFHHAAVVVGVGINQHCLRMRLDEHLFQIGEQ